MTIHSLPGHKILFSAPILPEAVGTILTDGDYDLRVTGMVDAIDWNRNGKLDTELLQFPTYYGKGTVNGARGALATEPGLLSPTLAQLKEYAQNLGVAVLSRDHLPMGVFVGETSSNGVKNFRPIETLVYQATETINPKATWAIDTVNNQFLVYEK